jgi:hypothetical protein
VKFRTARRWISKLEFNVKCGNCPSRVYKEQPDRPRAYPLEQFYLYCKRVPDPGRNEVVQLIAFAERKPLRYRLNALAIARTD